MLMRSPNNPYLWSFEQMERVDFEAMQKAIAQQEKYINQSFVQAPPTQEDVEVRQELYVERERDPELLEQRQRVKKMFQSWLQSNDPNLAQALNQQLTPRNIVDLYSDIPNMALLLVMPHLEDIGDLLGDRLEPFNQMLFDRHSFCLSVAVQLLAQLNESVPSPMLKQTSKFKKVAIAEYKGLSAVRELFSRDGQDLDFPGDGRIAWLFYRISQEADYLTRILLDPEPVEKRESLESNLRTLKLFEAVILGDRQLIAPSEDQQHKDLQILKTHKGFGYFTATIEKWAAKFASEHPDYDRAFFSPWNKARQSVLNDIRNGGGWRTQWIDRSGERQESKKGQKVKPRESKGKGFGNL
jgi:hypothetical protein